MSWFPKIKTAALLATMASMAVVASALEPIKLTADITSEHIGEFITIPGTTEQFHAPSSRREPYSFQLRDHAGQSIRVFAWPETMTEIKGWRDLATSGTLASVTAEVIDNEGEFELQIQDWAEVRLAEHGSADGATSTSTAMTTEALGHETTGTR